MITLEGLLIQIPDLPAPDLERWIVNDWVRPDGAAGSYGFQDIDVARIRLIRELRDELEINDAALPVVLLLLDQLYDLRRMMQDLDLARGRGGALGEDGRFEAPGPADGLSADE